MNKRDLLMLMIGAIGGGSIVGTALLAVVATNISINFSPSSSPTSSVVQAYALDGYCPVTLVEDSRWKIGDLVYREQRGSQVFLFAGSREQQLFRKNPERYMPAFAGNDVVLGLDSNQQVKGQRQHGIISDGRVYLFSSEDTLEQFVSQPDRYQRHLPSRKTHEAAQASHETSESLDN